ncbi:dimethylarginine dimethylaminohydrolase family protein [Bacillus sp. REN16]|uniref:dimethylarginine dimethylaminohydrolase family protein n=1 Tax=Bacillus sp. REN16 TaxID=2887296 RepID=UPI001E53F27E|nr:dimethylarginine dimethylaminohydrolase family protein [Bacillus sp. REN16]MCC3357002.1 dimethylarginine dimethylaminohydrolase family protein [Bacillus sp. REN16]
MAIEQTNEPYKISCYSEYDVLKKVILCQPQYMTIRDILNETQKHYKDEGINIEKALEQHDHFVKILRDHKIEVILLPYHKKYPEQVFTRDIGFTLGETVFVADMASEIRGGEENVLKVWLEDEEISYYNIIGHQIEGGDVIIDRDRVYIGLSSRTNQEAIDHLKKLLNKQFEIITIDFEKKYLHLDCVFNIVSPDLALIYPPALKPENIELLKSKYDLIEVTDEEAFTLGTNVLSIGDKKIISLPVNKKVNEELEKRGFEIIEVDITEIIKSGGSFRCCTLPIERKM